MSSLFDQLKNLGFATLPDSEVTTPSAANPEPRPDPDQPIRIRRETKGRNGKGVTVIFDLPTQADWLQQCAKQLRQQLSVGGALKDGCIELQGDQRQAAKRWFEQRGFTVKLAGG